jgi:hypothetical protein
MRSSATATTDLAGSEADGFVRSAYESIVFGAEPAVGDPWQPAHELVITLATSQGSPCVSGDATVAFASVEAKGAFRSLLPVKHAAARAATTQHVNLQKDISPSS